MTPYEKHNFELDKQRRTRKSKMTSKIRASTSYKTFDFQSVAGKIAMMSSKSPKKSIRHHIDSKGLTKIDEGPKAYKIKPDDLDPHERQIIRKEGLDRYKKLNEEIVKHKRFL